MTDMEMQMIRALAEIDRELGMPDDGCNSTGNTITAIRLLHAVSRDDRAEIERLQSIVARVEAVISEFEGMTVSGYRYMAAHIRDAIKA